VAHAYNPSYSGSRDQEDHGSKPAWENNLWDTTSEKTFIKNGWWSGSRCRLWVQTLVLQFKKKKKSNHSWYQNRKKEDFYQSLFSILSYHKCDHFPSVHSCKQSNSQSTIFIYCYCYMPDPRLELQHYNYYCCQWTYGLVAEMSPWQCAVCKEQLVLCARDQAAQSCQDARDKRPGTPEEGRFNEIQNRSLDTRPGGQERDEHWLWSYYEKNQWLMWKCLNDWEEQRECSKNLQPALWSPFQRKPWAPVGVVQVGQLLWWVSP
jgi:hypothetical protein